MEGFCSRDTSPTLETPLSSSGHLLKPPHTIILGNKTSRQVLGGRDVQTIALCKSSRQILIFSVFLSLGHCSALRPRTVPVNTHTLPPSSFLLRCQLCPLPCSEQMMDSPRTDSSALLAFPHIRSPWDTHHRFRCSPCHLQRCHFLHSSLACSPTTWRLL